MAKSGRNKGRRPAQRNLSGKFSNSRNVGPAKNVRGATSGGRGGSVRGPVINGDPRISGPRSAPRLEPPRPMKDITPRSPAIRTPTKALPSPGGAARAAGRGLARTLAGAAAGAAAVAFSPSKVASGTRDGSNERVPTQDEVSGNNVKIDKSSSAPKRGGTPKQPSSSREFATRVGKTETVTKKAVDTHNKTRNPHPPSTGKTGMKKVGSGPVTTSKPAKKKRTIRGPRNMDEYRSR